MPFASFERRKELVTQEASSHHVFSPANELCHPPEILTGRQPELLLDLMEELQSIPVK